jgi:hypothetical protein
LDCLSIPEPMSMAVIICLEVIISPQVAVPRKESAPRRANVLGPAARDSHAAQMTVRHGWSVESRRRRDSQRDSDSPETATVIALAFRHQPRECPALARVCVPCWPRRSSSPDTTEPAIGAPGFEPGTAPTRIMGEIRSRGKNHLQIDGFRGELPSSQILGFCGRFPGFTQRDRVAA